MLYVRGKFTWVFSIEYYLNQVGNEYTKYKLIQLYHLFLSLINKAYYQIFSIRVLQIKVFFTFTDFLTELIF